MFLLIVVLCLCAPLYAKHVAHTTPSANHITDTVGGKDVVSPGGIPTGPTWTGRFFLGADSNGRDVAVRLALRRPELTADRLHRDLHQLLLRHDRRAHRRLLPRRALDGVLSRTMDLIWAFPVILLGIALGTALAVGGLDFGLFTVNGASLWIPAIIIGVVYVPYMAKPLRGQVLSLREKEFVEAARSQGAGNFRIMFREILPNIASSIIVFIPLMIANAILLEAALSFLGAGVQAPNPSWGTMIGDGIRLIPSAMHLTLIPGGMLVLAVLGINVFGDGVRDALDPRAEVRIEH